MSNYCTLRFPKECNQDLTNMRQYLTKVLDCFTLEEAEASNELVIQELSLKESLGILYRFKKQFNIPYYYVVHGML